ncbi:MAG TPA: glycogen debranching N-terminal domain-containing protein [Thermoanaerobaculia bacterium]|jgi:glycogen debranching enzyme
MSTARVRPETLHAWRGPSLLIVDGQGRCGEEEPLSGYWFREARHLRTLRLEVNGERPWLCEAGAAEPNQLHFVFIHPERTRFGGGGSGQSTDTVEIDEHGTPFRSLDLRLTYQVRAASLEVELLVTNRALQEVEVEFVWRLDADFADLLEAQGGERQQEARIEAAVEEGAIHFFYRHPRLPFETHVASSEDRAWEVREDRIAVRLCLAPQRPERLGLTVLPIDPESPMDDTEAARREERLERWAAGLARIGVPGNPIAERVIASNVRDLASFPLLEGADDELLALQAGVPLYPALFGRDTLTAGWQAAFLDRGESLAASLARLGRMQTDRFLNERDEEPGRIPFQVRRGPLARLGLNPFGAYYADFASPLMFVISLAHLYAWTGEKRDLERHWDTVRRILDWAREHGDRDGDGYLEYETKAPQGPKHQGWKDSGNAIVDEQGRPVPTPLGTCEIQGYWFAAQQLMAVLAWVMGERGDALAYLRSATDLKERFNRDWWLEDEGFPALALDPDKRPVRTIGSNAGHCLASGILSGEHVPRVVERLFAPDLFSGWGVRTLSTRHPSYAPLSYHRGSVWAVENATIALGLRRFGFDVRADELAGALFDLAQLYPEGRIPECVGGYDRWERPFPGAYPRANTPQTWNASAFPLLVHTLLGLQPVAALDLLVVDPALPSWLPEVIVRGLRIGGATATLRFWRDDSGASHAEILEKGGALRLLRQPPPESLQAGLLDRFRALIDGILHR